MNTFEPIGSALPPRRDEIKAATAEIPVSAPASGDFDPIVQTDAGQRIFELIEREQLPGDVRSTLAGALTGDLTRQALLFQAMVDTWPRLQKALGELKRKVRKAPWSVAPFSRRGEDPEPVDEERAKFIEDLIWQANPDAKRNEKPFEGLIEDLVWAYFAGHHVIETLWDRTDDGAIAPRAFKAVPPRFYGYPTEPGAEDALMFDPAGQQYGYDYQEFPEHHFLIAINGSHPGHPTVAAPLRALTGYWLAANFGLKWLLSFSQLYGVPFRWATYSDKSNKAAVCQMLENIGSAGYAAFEQGTELNFVEAKKSAEQLPQKMLIEMADKQVDIFILGQSLTSDSGTNGSRSLGEVHNEVRQEVIEGVADFAADIINRQLFASMIALNYGKTSELPYIEAKFERPKDEKGMAERDAILLGAGVRMSTEWFHDRHGIPIPSDDEETISPVLPNGVQGDPATAQALEEVAHETKARRVEAKSDDEELTPEALSEAVLEGLTGVSVEWLAPVKPFFQRLAALASSKTVTDEDFTEALAKANTELPELFEVLDTKALEEAFEKAIGSGIAGGSADRYTK